VLVLWQECISLTFSLMQASAPPPLQAKSGEMIGRRSHLHRRFCSTDLCFSVAVEIHRKPVLVQFAFNTSPSQVQERADDVSLVMDGCFATCKLIRDLPEY
jgi:hypothetical protein